MAAPADQPARDQAVSEAPSSRPPISSAADARLLWRQWAMTQAVMANRSSDKDELFALADRIFAWVMETRA